MQRPSPWHRRRMLLVATITMLAMALGACATLERQTWFQQTRDVTVKAAGTATAATGKALKRMQGYVAKKELLETFRDSAEHSEDAVLDVLRRAGVGRAAGNRNAPSSGGAPTPSSKPAPSAPKSTTPAVVPETYAGYYRWPVDAGIISSEYGARWGKTHKGLDIAANTGEPIYAVAPGEVIYSGSGLSGYGNVIILRHDQQMTTLYAHNSALKVKQGAQVKQGDLIALLGSTGRSTGPHVHFEMRKGDQAVNPRTLLPQSMVAEAAFGRGVIREYLAQRR